MPPDTVQLAHQPIRDDGTVTAEPAARPPDHLGRVVSVSGSQVVMLLEDQSRHTDRGIPTSQIGSLVKIPTAISTVYGLISGLSIPIPAVRAGEPELRVVELELVGEAVTEGNNAGATFRRGVSVLPGLGDPVLSAAKEDLQQVYTRTGVATVRIGSIYQDRSLPAALVIDDLLGKHFAVVGTTGSGKSCAVALILGAILRQCGSGHIVLLDLHNEYSRAFGEAAEHLDIESLELPYWLLTFEEIVEIVAGSRNDRHEEDVAVLAEVILAAKQRYAGQSDKGGEPISVDTPVPYRLGDVNRMLDEAMGKLERTSSSAPYLRLKGRIASLQSDQRYGFMFPSGLSIRDNMAGILSRLFRIPANGKPMSTIDLSGIPSEVMNVVVSVLCRLTFDFALWNPQTMPIVLVCEEAHRYAPRNECLGFEPAKRALSRIAKEGRKYGVSLCVVSQRPSELSPDMLSQCNTVFALRLSSQHDQDFVRGTLAESAMGLLDVLPSLRDAEALVVGEGVPLPQRICFDQLPEDARPSRGNTSFSAAWEDASETIEMVQATIARWRRQHR